MHPERCPQEARATIALRYAFLRTLLSLWLGATLPFFPLAVQADVAISRPAPAFSLPDVDGKARALKEFRGKPVVLFFFCGCTPCHECSRVWAQAQQSGALTMEANSKVNAHHPRKPLEPVTLVVYTGEREAARSFVAATGLDTAHMVLLTDPDVTVARAYDVAQCPRVFVLDARGILRYTNNETDAKSNAIAAPILVSRTLTALRKLAMEPAKPAVTRANKKPVKKKGSPDGG